MNQPTLPPSFAMLGSLLAPFLAGAGALAGGPDYGPPPGYYDGATGVGADLKTQLEAAMTAGHIQRTYGEFRFSAAIHDQDPANPSRIILVYNGDSIPATWDSGATWNREHVWPQSRQPGDASNSTRGNLGDPHALRPCNPSINSSRGNKPFADADTTGPHGSLGEYYFPGDADKGDIARSLFYSDTRWGATAGLSLVNSFPVGNQMGSLDACIAWHYLDEPDAFEVRRNHAVFSQTMNPQYYTNNRNAFVDLPGTVWSVYVDQQNDTTLWVGNSPDADGSSAELLVLNALVGQNPTADAAINKAGDDGTYYSVTPSPGLSSSMTGRHNAFPIGLADTARSILIEPAPGLTVAPGVFDEQVVINNLDVTLEGGQGHGANDADDLILVEINVFDPATASLDPATPVSQVTIDLGVVNAGDGDAAVAFDLYNIAPAFTGAPMDIDPASASGDTAVLTTTFTPVLSLPAGSGRTFLAVMDDDSAGVFDAVYTFHAFSDRALFADPGAPQSLVVHLVGQVNSCTPDFAEPYGTLNFFDVSAFLALYAAQNTQADLTGDGLYNFFDVSMFLDLYGAGCP